MFEKPNSTHVLGLDIDAFSLKGAAIRQVRGKLKLEILFDFPIESATTDDPDVKPLYTSEQKKQLQDLVDQTLVVTPANTQDILVRPLELKLKKDSDIEAALMFQVEPLLPYPAENAIIDKVLLAKDQEGSKLTVFAIRKDHLTNHLKQWNSLDIDPEIVSASPQALVLFANQFYEFASLLFIVHIGIDHSFAVTVDQGKLLAAQAIPLGLRPLIEIISQEKRISLVAAYAELLHTPLSQLEIPSLKSHIDALKMNVTRTLYSLAKQLKGKEIKEIVITGPGATLEDLSEILHKSLNKTLLIPKDFSDFGAPAKELLHYALPIGEALSALPKCKDQVNFRQQDFLYPEPWKRLKQPIFLYFLLCLGIAIALFTFGKSYVSYQEGEMRQQYLNLLQTMNKSYAGFEQEYLTKVSKGSSTDEHSQIGSLDLEEIKMRLNFLEREIQSTPQIFPLQPNTPLVSDVLAWISSHPNFIDKQTTEGDASTPAAMHLESFSYTMVKRPEPTKKQDKYQVKVELEFSSPTPKMAREFHDALITPNDMIDPKGEIKWNSNRDRYRTSFFLKDRTIYPNL